MTDEYERGENCKTVNNNIIYMDTLSESAPPTKSGTAGKREKGDTQNTDSHSCSPSSMRDVNLKVSQLSLGSVKSELLYNLTDSQPLSVSHLSLASPEQHTEMPNPFSPEHSNLPIHFENDSREPQPLPTSQFFPTDDWRTEESCMTVQPSWYDDGTTTMKETDTIRPGDS